MSNMVVPQAVLQPCCSWCAGARALLPCCPTRLSFVVTGRYNYPMNLTKVHPGQASLGLQHPFGLPHPFCRFLCHSATLAKYHSGIICFIAVTMITPCAYLSLVGQAERVIIRYQSVIESHKNNKNKNKIE